MVRSVGPYRIPAVWVDSYGYYTNLPPAAAYRGAMSSQTAWAYESHLDSIAHRLGIDPLELRRRNLLRSGDQFATGETMHDIHFVECMERCAADLGWEQPYERPTSGSIRRGHGLAVMMKSTAATSRSQCRMVMDDQGRLTLYTSTVEMGQGAHTALAQIAADTVGVPIENVTVIGPDTAQTPIDSMTSASRSTNAMGTAILAGGETLRRKLIEAAVPLLEVEPEQLSVGDGTVFVTDNPEQAVSYTEILQRGGIPQVEATGEYSTKGGLDPETGQGIATPHWHQGAGACEVGVDTETGKVRVLRYAAAAFAGKVVNPVLANLQNDGNVIYGLGPALMEEMVLDSGQVVNPNLSDYMIPSFLDVPPELHSHLIESDHGEFHGIGEMTLPPVAPAIANAVFDAVGVRIRDLPITAEKVLHALMEQNDGHD
jgi:CO/xanthine dehydrogenase Mo-binding subunit